MEKFDTQFFVIEHDKEKNLLKVTWRNTEEMETDSYQKAMLEYIAFHEKHPAPFLITDTRNFEMAIGLETQAWLDETIAPRQIALGMKKAAFLVSSDFIAQLSLEQAVDEQANQPFELRFFDNEEEALDWLAE